VEFSYEWSVSGLFISLKDGGGQLALHRWGKDLDDFNFDTGGLKLFSQA
jgi:hypothetical protein